YARPRTPRCRCPTSTPCCSCSASRATRSRRPTPPIRRPTGRRRASPCRPRVFAQPFPVRG
ncbi:MAG: hypothetical protein AVDCRST_MAG16-616, partial [uncultured Frankineae bacterium]